MNDGTPNLPPFHSELRSTDQRQQFPALQHASINITSPNVPAFGIGNENDNYNLHQQKYHSFEIAQSKILKFLVLGAAGAGKTSILRRYFYNKFDWDRMPTLGSDFYSTKLKVETGEGNSEGSSGRYTDIMQLNIQMWDTPGKERYVVNSKRKHAASSITESFFMHADAIMLVYDMTSSTSFKQLLKWYADLMEIYQRDKQEKFQRIPPILVCATKLDLFKARNSTNNEAISRSQVQQRDVFGLNRNFRGHDFQYEYQICPRIPSHAELPVNVGTVGGSGLAQISSYLANRENWTSDGSYLESLLHSEDASHPDREMVVLWCLRNGLSHFEVSAAT